MCLIGIAGKGTDKYSDKFINAIKTGAVNNKDGYGFCAKYDGVELVSFKKGYTDIDILLEDVKKLNLTINDELIIHSRRGNKGKLTDYNCHPFVLSDKQNEILELEGTSADVLMVHNGTFFKYSNAGSDYSDTYHFIKQFMCIPEFINLLKRDKTLFCSIFDITLSTNKLAFMFPDHDIITIGDFIEDEGYKFSNKCYLDVKIEDVGGKTTESKNKNLKTMAELFATDSTSEFSARNAFGIPVNQWTIGEIYFEKKESYTTRLLRLMINPEEDFYISGDYYWGKEIDDSVINGKKTYNECGIATCHMISKGELRNTVTILPLNQYRTKYADYATLLCENYASSKNQMKKVLKGFLNSAEDGMVTIKGMKGPLNRDAVLLYLKLHNHVLKDSQIRNIKIGPVVKQKSNEVTDIVPID